jgi:hypothetical protein
MQIAGFVPVWLSLEPMGQGSGEANLAGSAGGGVAD